MKKQLYTLLLMVCITGAVTAQDIHFSQFYNSPLTLNPALTGLSDGKMRAGIIYRDQWRSVTSPFTTTAGYVDVPIHKGLKNDDVVGVGGMVFYDKTGTAGLSNLTAVVSAAYHKTLGVSHTHVLSFGVQIGITQRRLDLSKAVFGDQMDATLGNTNSTGDASNIGTKLHEEFNAGLGYSGKIGARNRIYLGGAVFHITQPKESLIKTSDARLPFRAVAHGGMDIGINDKLSILPSVIYMYQAKAYELNFGTAVAYAFKSDIKALLGLYYRYNDAVIPTIGLDVKGAHLGFSYDVNVSNLTKASSNRGGFELSLFYVLPYKKMPYEYSIIYSPRF